jgi:hypothetical protein
MNQLLGSRMEPGYVPTGVVAQGPDAEAPAGVAGLAAAAAGRSAVSWPAIVAGAFVTVSAALILIVLGSGLGFAAVSPWPGHGASAAGLTVAATIWLIVTQWISAALGGYIAGRLRTKWTGTHTHEVFFRDTAHGLITWSVATVFVAWVIAGSASSLLGGGLHAAAGMASTAAAGPAGGAQGPASAAMTYEIDRLLRSSGASATTGAGSAGANIPEAGAGISGAEDDAARKAAAQASIYTALSLLIGAFIASVSAALGGRLRDQHV